MQGKAIRASLPEFIRISFYQDKFCFVTGFAFVFINLFVFK